MAYPMAYPLATLNKWAPGHAYDTVGVSVKFPNQTLGRLKSETTECPFKTTFGQLSNFIGNTWRILVKEETRTGGIKEPNGNPDGTEPLSFT